MSFNKEDLSQKDRSLARDVNDEEEIYVITRTGRKELLDPNQITKRLQQLIKKHPKINHVNPYELMLVVSQGIKSGISTYEIDEYAGNAAASLSISNPYYAKLAARIVIDNHQKNTDRSFVDKMRKVYLRQDDNGIVTPLVSQEFFKYVEEHQDRIEKMIDYNRDFLFDFFGFRTFQTIYGFKINNKVVERPQDLYMRVAVALHMNTSNSIYNSTSNSIDEELLNIESTYNALSNRLYTHASPTYFNAGTDHNQFASCYLLGTSDDIDGIKDPGKNMAILSKWGGGIGFHFHGIRSRGELIRGTNGRSSGIVPFLQEYNATLRSWNQGGNRPGAGAVYLMPHHPDIMEFLKLKLPGGIETERAHDLFYAVWIPDIFMERVKVNGMWSLFDPNRTVDLSNYYDSADELSYTNKYIELENAKLYKRQIKARDVWEAIYESNKQKGVPYLCSSDAVNKHNNQRNIGIGANGKHNQGGAIKSSNLCSEIMEYSDTNETAVCVLSSISLPAHITDVYTDEELLQPEEKRRELNHEFPINPQFDFKKLIETVKLVVINLNRIIDINFYPIKEAQRSNLRHRPLGIGIQGLADVYMKMRYPFESELAHKLNKLISETMYYAAVSQSTRMCRERYKLFVKSCTNLGKITLTTYKLNDYAGHRITYNSPNDIPKTVASYPSMLWNGGSPISKGIFHWELYGLKESEISGMYDWGTLRDHILQYGVMNSLFIALMPTASTSILLNNNECFEPYTSNIYKRKTLAGEYIIINKWLINDLYRLGLWNSNMKDYLIACNGSIQNIDGIPNDLKLLYKTAYEIDQSVLIQQAIDRQPFVDQGQSLNWYLHQATLEEFTRLSFKAYRGKLKTWKYYLHTMPAMQAQKFSIDPALQKEMSDKLEEDRKKRRDLTFMVKEEPICDSCSG